MELKKITEKVYYIPNSPNIGLIKIAESAVILIDSGLDDDTARKLLKLLTDNGLLVKAIINTHSHADHCGANQFIKAKTKATIYAPEVESAIIQYPYLEPFYLFSGANPPKDLQNKFLMASSSEVDHVIKASDNILRIDGLELVIIRLPGHTSNQIGIEFEKVLFCADSLFSLNLLKRHKIPFYADIDKAKETLRFLKDSQYKYYLPSHAEPNYSLVSLIDENLNIIVAVEQYILNILNEKKIKEQILQEICSHFKINLNNIQQYYLINTIVMAYLSSLYGRGKINIEISENYLFWLKI